MQLRLFRKESVIFTAGVICGFFIRSFMAKNVSSDNEDSFQDIASLDDFIRSIQEKIDNWGKNTEAKDQDEAVPECFMKVPEIVQSSGYPIEEHYVKTKDGYILGLHRINHEYSAETKADKGTKPAVLLQHGLLADSANWISNGPKNSLAFQLADHGLDVWLGNVRGNTYSRQHDSLNPDVDEKFWRYSWQQFSEIDLPAMTDYIREKTNNEKIYYIGHSQGSLIMFARLAEDREFNKKIHMFIALGPVFSLHGIKSPIKYFAQFYNTLEVGQWVMGGAELLPNSAAGKWLSTKIHRFMGNHDDFRFIGENLLLSIAGFSPSRYCIDRLPVYLAHTPAGTSIQNIIHFAQMVAHNDTRKYRFPTEEENQAAYGSSIPPTYDLTAINVPVALYWGTEDWFADTEDVLSIIPKLKTLIKTKELKRWDHLEFLYGSEASRTLYLEIAHMILDNEEKLNSHASHSEF